jgi:murein DD-endopeptidase MepM/ murein hydrolase activator NlpD
LLKFAIGFFKFFFAKRTILFVTNKGIRTVILGPISQICLLSVVTWAGNLFVQSCRYDNVINSKSAEIAILKDANHYFEEEFVNVNDKLKKINDYLISVTGQNHLVNGEERVFKLPNSIKEEDLSKEDKHTLNQIKGLSYMLSDMQSIVNRRAKKIENAVALTGLNLKRISNNSMLLQRATKEASVDIANVAKREIATTELDAMGGPLIIDNIDGSDKSLDKAVLQGDDEKIKFTNDIDRLMVLEKLVKTMPLSRPMQNYYVSSGFGARVDPITHGFAIHQGLDFIGVDKAKILSPSSGKVILARRFSDYGNAVVIDHGFGVTTRYGHLSAIKVTEGQIVKKGEVIALQGSTGRSTGQHLHYEVRYKNTPLNPKRFLDAGDSLFNDSTNSHYANS